MNKQAVQTVAVLGAGSIGSVLGAILAQGGLSVSFIERNEAIVQAINTHGLAITGIRGDWSAPVKAAGHGEEIGPVDLVLVMVKSYDTAAAMDEHIALLGDNTLVVTLQNGMGNDDALLGVVGNHSVLAGTTTLGANRLDDTTVRFAGDGDTLLGAAGQTDPQAALMVAETFSRAGLPTKAHPAVQEVIWNKVVVNAAINPLTALLGVPNGELATQDETRRIMRQVVEEAQAVAEAEGVMLDAQTLYESVLTVCRKTAPNRSSMLMDVLNERRTEIDAINGAVTLRGEAQAIRTPTNELLWKLVRTRQATYELARQTRQA